MNKNKLTFTELNKIINYMNKYLDEWCLNKDNFYLDDNDEKPLFNDIQSFIRMYNESYEQSHWHAETIDHAIHSWCEKYNIDYVDLFDIWLNQKQLLIFDYNKISKK